MTSLVGPRIYMVAGWSTWLLLMESSECSAPPTLSWTMNNYFCVLSYMALCNSQMIRIALWDKHFLFPLMHISLSLSLCQKRPKKNLQFILRVKLLLVWAPKHSAWVVHDAFTPTMVQEPQAFGGLQVLQFLYVCGFCLFSQLKITQPPCGFISSCWVLGLC